VINVCLQKLLELREQRGESPVQVAAALGCGVRTYLRYERGEAFPKLSLLLKMADYFDVSTDALIGRSTF